MNPIKWIERRWQSRFPGQFASMVSHTLVTMGAAIGAAVVVPRVPLIPAIDPHFTLAITATVVYMLYHLREIRQKRAYEARGGEWSPAKVLARNSDLIGPAVVMVSFWVAWLLL